MLTNKYITFLCLVIINICHGCSKDDSYVIGKLIDNEMDKIADLKTPDVISFIHISDTHSSSITFDKAIYALNNHPVDFAIITGDILPNEDMIEKMKSARKPIFVIPGNHDCYDRFYQRGFYSQVACKIMYDDIHFGHESCNYFYADFHKDNKTLRIIGLDQYETNEYNEDTNCVVYSQEQINWLCNLLRNSTDVDKIILLIHAGFGNKNMGRRNIYNSGKFISSLSTHYPNAYDYGGESNPLLIPDILSAYQTGRNINNKVYRRGYKEQTVTVNTRFSSPSANFLAYFGGHLHWDEIETLENYKQLQCLMTYCGPGIGSSFNDLIKDSAEEDTYNFNINCINFNTNKLLIYRIGAKKTITGLVRDSISFLI